ncbi:MAG: hypothetical protein JO130_18680 [Solirubrobacterales bacterium]|nr:hypothetical protein [Solirubrobacterales bacterium]
MGHITQYDSIEPDTIPADAEAVAGYVGGFWPDYSELCALFPNARHKSVCVNAFEDGDILDIENGDAVPVEYPGWHRRQKARGLALPGAYADESEMPSVIAAASDAGIAESEYVRWVAWLGIAVIPEGMHARQYTFSALGRNLDASVCEEGFWAPSPSPPARNAVHYSWFATGPFKIGKYKFDERAVVKMYDKYRAMQTSRLHPYRALLAVLRRRLGKLAGRVYAVAHEQPVKGRPSWGVDRRGWRYQQLIHRSQGQRFA